MCNGSNPSTCIIWKWDGSEHRLLPLENSAIILIGSRRRLLSQKRDGRLSPAAGYKGTQGGGAQPSSFSKPSPGTWRRTCLGWCPHRVPGKGPCGRWFMGEVGKSSQCSLIHTHQEVWPAHTAGHGSLRPYARYRMRGVQLSYLPSHTSLHYSEQSKVFPL